MIRLYRDNLTKTEKHIAQVIINLGSEFNDYSIEKLARVARVSPAMVVKYAKKCDFTGYKELKYYVIINQSKKEIISQNYVEFQANKVADFFTYLAENPQIVSELAKKIRAAKYIVFYGHGPSLGVANYFANKISAVAKRPVVVQSDEQMMNLEIETKRSDRLVILLSASLKTDLINQKIRQMEQTDDNYFVVCENHNYDIATRRQIQLTNVEIDYDYSTFRDRTLFFIYFELVFNEICEIVHVS